jgi:protein-disulfide isomerase
VGREDHVAGPPDAPITLVEYGDYQCPYCGQAYPIVKQLQEEFSGSLLLVFRNFPLTNVHPNAERAAEAAEAAGFQGLFWEMHDAIYEHQYDLADDALLRYARAVGADDAKVAEVLTTGGARARVERDVESAVRSGANGTPTFFVNGIRYDGSWAFEPFAEHLRALLP